MVERLNAGSVPAQAPAFADPLPARAREAVIHRILSLMEYWSITVDDLEDATRPAVPPRSSAPAAPKYRHPVSGLTWDGQGPHPQWLRDALLHEGYTVQQLRDALRA